MGVLDPVLRKTLPWIYRVSDDAIRWFLFALAAFILGWGGSFYTKAWSALLHKTADMNTLVSLGTGLLSLLRGEHDRARVFRRAWHCPDVYFEAAILIVGFRAVRQCAGEQSEGTDCECFAETGSTATEVRSGSAEWHGLDLPVESIHEGDITGASWRAHSNRRASDFGQEHSGRVDAQGRVAAGGEGCGR